MSTRSSILAVAFLCVFSACALAGSAASGGAQVAPTDNSAVSTYKVADTSPGANVQVGAASASTSQPSGSSTTNASSAGGFSSGGSASSNGVASSNGSAPSAYGISSGGTRDSNDVATQIKREKVIDTGDKAIETDKPAKVESNDKTFAPGLLDKVSDISAVGAQKEHGSSSKIDDSKSSASAEKDDSHK